MTADDDNDPQANNSDSESEERLQDDHGRSNLQVIRDVIDYYGWATDYMVLTQPALTRAEACDGIEELKRRGEIEVLELLNGELSLLIEQDKDTQQAITEFERYHGIEALREYLKEETDQ